MDGVELQRVERQVVAVRIEQGTPSGDLTLNHLRAIHRHLFQDIYEWAGHIRTINIGKDETVFRDRRSIAVDMASIEIRLADSNYLRGLDRKRFALSAAEIIGDINSVHPFREGNGRTQIEYLRHLSLQAGHSFSATGLSREPWITASRDAIQQDYSLLARQIELGMIEGERLRVSDAREQLRSQTIDHGWER